jgi:membrane peptidoglycan carboxypeptidase
VSSYPNTVAPLLGLGGMPGYQAGSTFKIFTMLGRPRHGPAAQHEDQLTDDAGVQYAADGRQCGGRWCPHNASAAMTGVQTMWSGSASR